MKRILVILGVLLLVGAVASVQAEGLEGKSEIMAAGSILHAYGGGGGITAQILGLDYGKFVTPNIEARGELMLIHGKPSGSSDSGTVWLFAPAAVYNFVPERPSAYVPYVGVGLSLLGIDFPGFSETSTKLQYMAGVKMFIGGDYETANKAVFIEYRHLDVTIEDVDAGLDMVWGGISVIF